VTEIGGEALEPPPLQNEVVRAEDPTEVARVSPNAILDRNLFGAQLAGEVQVTAPIDDQEELEETKLPLRLLGTAAATETTRSRAAIQDEKQRKHLVVGIGDELQGLNRVRVKDIQRTRVVLDNRGKLEELLLHEDGPRVAAAPPRKAARDARQARRAPQRDTLSDRLSELSGEDGEGLSRILSSARIVPEYDPESGEMLGMKVDAIKANSLFQKVGLVNGDVITEVNGIVVDRLEATSAIFDELATADEINVAATRGNEAVFLSASAEEVMEQ
jgi:general secretion pathway protein C